VSFFSFELDPLQVLGVSAQATLEEIRAAYREKAKRYHPDKGGEDWTFRILSQAYEMLSTARVARASQRDPYSGAPQPKAQGHAQAHAHAHSERAKPERQTESAHAGIFDHEAPRSRLVAVELLCIRYLWDDADYLWLTQRVPDEDRFLSCNLTISWPDENTASRALSHDEQAHVLTSLQQVFDQMIVSTRVVSSRSRIQDDQFSGWLAYSNFDRAYKAVGALHQALKSQGMGMRQWSRDLFIPRTRR
jgi:curved DNA-binding protein CbpA